MNSPNDSRTAPSASRISRRALLTMGAILVVLALLALFSIIQDARREQIETVTITPVSPAAATPDATPSPAEP